MASFFFESLFSRTCISIYFVAFTVACSSEITPTEGEKISKGLIEYAINYPQIPEDSYLQDLMPKSMETIFLEGNFRSDIVAGMGLFKTSIICEKDKSNLVHSVKMLNKKYFSTFNYEEIRDFNPIFKEIEITPLEETKEIAGFLCHASKVMVKGDSSWSFKLYYTYEIEIPQSNQHTPFKSIDGVLMQYDIVSYDTHMRFIAEKVTPKENIEMDEIQLEDGYETVSHDELKNEIKSIFASVQK